MQEHKRERVKKRISLTSEDEKIVTVSRQFPVVLRMPLIIGLLIVVIGIMPSTIGYGINASWLQVANYWLVFWVLFLLIYWLRSWVGWHYSVYVLTNQRILIVKQSGFFSREVADLALHNIQNVNYAVKGLQGAMFGFGTIRIDTLSGSGSLKMRYVHHPERLQKMIMEAVHKSTKAEQKSSTKEA